MNNCNPKCCILLLLALSMLSCSYDFPVEDESNEGEGLPEDFSNFYVLGDTYASGFMDGALYNEGQEFSYPNLFGMKLNEIYSAPVFQQAEISSEFGYNAEATEERGSIKGRYSLLYRTLISIYPARSASNEGDALNTWNGSLADLHDFSFPGMKSFEADSSAVETNAYYQRINARGISPADLVIDTQPGAVLIHLGYDDILNYSLNGGVGYENPAPNNIGEHDLTPVPVFEDAVKRLVSRIRNETDSDIFMATVFNPLVSPYFQSINYALETEKYSAGYLGSVGSHYADFNYNVFQYNDVEDGGAPTELDRPRIIVDPMGYPQVSPYNRARVIVDEYLNDAVLNDGTVIPKWRQLGENELVLYKSEPNLNESSPLSGEVPLSDAQVLTEPEIAFINDRVAAFNRIIRDIASENAGVHLIDFESVITEIEEEAFIYDGVRPSLQFNRYGIFSSDGYTLNPRGNAIFTNELIRAVNKAYGSNLEFLDINAYRGNEFLGNFN